MFISGFHISASEKQKLFLIWSQEFKYLCLSRWKENQQKKKKMDDVSEIFIKGSYWHKSTERIQLFPVLSALTSPDLPPHLCTNCAFCWAAMPTFPFKVCLTCKVLGSQGFSTPPIRRKIFSEIPCISFVGLWWSQTHPPLFCTDLYSELISSAISISNWWRTETKIVVRFMYLHST